MVDEVNKTDKEELPFCGIIMPISAIDGCNEYHWNNVKIIISEAISDAGFNPRIVSTSDDIGVIQSRIVQNLYFDKIVVCDVSGKNPNVMFELGMRLAFDKPTIIIMDDRTDYSFDTSIIEHIRYPRSLDYCEILGFKQILKDKIIATVKKAEEQDYPTFLKQFGEFKTAKIEKTDAKFEDMILNKLENLSSQVIRMQNNEISADRDSLIRDIIMSKITDYCKKNNIPESDIRSGRDLFHCNDLRNQLFQDSLLLKICKGDIERLNNEIKFYIFPY